MPDIVIVGAVDSTEIAVRAAMRAPGWRVRMVCTLPPDRSRRHSDFRDLAPAASDAGAELLFAPRINDAEVLDRIRATGPDLLFICGWSQICGPEFMNIAPGRVLGYHPAALPRLRGRAALPWTILNQEPITAGTLFWIDEGVDTGDIVEQQFFHVAPDETAATLYAKHMRALDRMVGSALERIGSGQGAGQPQDDRYATYAARRGPADGRIDWSWPTATIDRLIRAVGRPYPGAFSHIGEQRIILWSAAPEQGGERQIASPGQIVAVDDTGFVVKTRDGLIRVTEWEYADGVAPKLHAKLNGA